MNQTVTFQAEGGNLVGTLHLPGSPAPPVVIGSHGLLGTRNSAKQVALAEACSSAGMAFLRFDHRGCGESDPAAAGSDLLTTRVADLLAAVSWAASRPDIDDRFGLFGSSMGGAICLAAAPACAPVAMVTWAAPVTSEGVNVSSPEAALPPGIHCSAFDLTGHLRDIRNICVCHGDQDQVVPVDNAHTIYDGVRDPRNRIIFQGADHRLSQPDNHRRFVSASVRWFARHLFAGAGEDHR